MEDRQYLYSLFKHPKKMSFLKQREAEFQKQRIQ